MFSNIHAMPHPLPAASALPILSDDAVIEVLSRGGKFATQSESGLDTITGTIEDTFATTSMILVRTVVTGCAVVAFWETVAKYRPADEYRPGQPERINFGASGPCACSELQTEFSP